MSSANKLALAESPWLTWVELPRDNGAHPGVGVENWWIASHLKAGDRVLGTHVDLLLPTDISAPIIGWASITDFAEIALHQDFSIPRTEAEIALDKLSLRTPNITFEGSLEEMSLSADFDGGEIKLKLRPRRPVIYNAGTGQFPLFKTTTFQHSFADIETSGSLTFGGATYAVSGGTWFDKQRFIGEIPAEMGEGGGSGDKMTWFGLCLDNGVVISLWETNPGGTWSTIVYPDGTHILTQALKVGPSAGGHVPSKLVAHKSYPSTWEIQIPSRGAKLQLQGRLLHDGLIHTTSVAISGVYEGEPASGYGFVDKPGSLDT